MGPSKFAGLRFARTHRLSLFLLLCLSFAPLCGNAQVLYGSLTGNVSDPTAMVTQANGMAQSSNNTKLDDATISHPWLPRIISLCSGIVKFFIAAASEPVSESP